MISGEVETDSVNMNRYHNNNLRGILIRYGNNGLSNEEIKNLYSLAVAQAKENPDGRDEVEQATGLFRHTLDIILMEKQRKANGNGNNGRY